MTLEEIKKVVSHSLGEIKDFNIRSQITPFLVEPRKKIVEHLDSSGASSSCQVWVVCDMQERDVVLLYSSGGYSLEGYPWGISFRRSKDSGPPSCWYRSLEECALDSGYLS